MEPGHIWEDLIQQNITGENIFDEKYFICSVNEFPTSKHRPPIPEIMELAFEINPEKPVDYIRSKLMLKADGKPRNCNFNDMLAEIADNGGRRPVPKQLWLNMQDAWENFQKYIFTDKEKTCKARLVDLWGFPSTQWQVEHFWEDNEIKCREKLDVWAPAMIGGLRMDFIFDIKWTACIKQFRRNWKSKLIYQAIHYEYGFKDLLRSQHGMEFDDVLYFIVAENKPPFVIYGFYLTEDDFIRNIDLYYRHLSDCWDWMQAGKPCPGWVEMKPLDSYARPVHDRI
jgi:hypothetical protein